MIGRTVKLTWKGESKDYSPNIGAIIHIENVVKAASGRHDFNIGYMLQNLDRDPAMFALVWGTMLHSAGHELADGIPAKDAQAFWHQKAWDALISSGSDKAVETDLISARDAISAMVMPKVDMGKPAAPQKKGGKGQAGK